MLNDVGSCKVFTMFEIICCTMWEVVCFCDIGNRLLNNGVSGMLLRNWKLYVVPCGKSYVFTILEIVCWTMVKVIQGACMLLRILKSYVVPCGKSHVFTILEIRCGKSYVVRVWWIFEGDCVLVFWGEIIAMCPYVRQTVFIPIGKQQISRQLGPKKILSRRCFFHFGMAHCLHS